MTPLKKKIFTAVNYFNAGKNKEAEMECYKLLKKNEDNFDAIHLLALIKYKQEKTSESISLFKKALLLDPKSTQVHFNLAKAFREKKEYEKAIYHYKIVCEKSAENLQAWKELGISFSRGGYYEQAIKVFKKVIFLEEKNPDLLCELGLAQTLLGKLEDAKLTLEKSLKINATHSPSWINLAVVNEHMGKTNVALSIYEKILSYNKTEHNVSLRQALALLSLCNFDQGWKKYKVRYLWPQTKTLHKKIDIPFWNGESIPGKLLVWTEQGLGDEIIFGTIINDLIKDFKDVKIACSERMQPIFKKAFPKNQVIPREINGIASKHLRDINYQASLTEVASIYRPNIESFKSDGIYLKSNEKKTEELKAKYRKGRKIPLIGISWRSSNTLAQNQKSMPLINWENIINLSSAEFISLQYGNTDAEKKYFYEKTGIELISDSEIIPEKNFQGFINQVHAMDLVISVSNTTVHVAGALGVPTWAIIAKGTGRPWYWFNEHEECLWYKSVKIYNQRNSGDWTEPRLRIEQDLNDWKKDWKN